MCHCSDVTLAGFLTLNSLTKLWLLTHAARHAPGVLGPLSDCSAIEVNILVIGVSSIKTRKVLGYIEILVGVS